MCIVSTTLEGVAGGSPEHRHLRVARQRRENLSPKAKEDGDDVEFGDTGDED